MDFPNDFLHENNVAGQTLLNLVSRGSSTIAEMLRLADNIPGVFTGEDSQEAEKYKDIIHDFTYLKKQDQYDERIEKSERLLDLDDEFRENHIEILQRFYELFESIVRFHGDFLQFIRNIRDGMFLQYSFENLMNDTDGCQLIAEAIYLYGVMLLIMDVRLPGPVREKLIISYYRWKGSIIESTIRGVVKICRSTGFVYGGTKRPKKYPDSFFARFPIPHDIIDIVVGKLKEDDIYNASASWPSPSHRTTMLSPQGSILYVILYFAPHILHKQQATMRSIVDRYYSDQWVIPVYMGILVDLNDWWDFYKAAKAALKNTMHRNNIERIIDIHKSSIPILKKELKKYLTEGVLTEDFVMDSLNRVLTSLRNCNVLLRWTMLHRNCSNKKYRESIINLMGRDDILSFLMQNAQFEFKIKSMIQSMLKLKKERWNNYKKECYGRMVELSEYFSGDKPLTRIKKNNKLQKWFSYLAAQIDSLDVDGSSNVEGRKLLKIMKALEDVQRYHQIDNSLQIKQFLHDTESYLRKMVRTVHVRDSVIATLAIVSDFSYAWELMTEYIKLMQTYIKKNPAVVLTLRAIFLKMVSILDLPLNRINQCGSEDLVSVSAYYSEKLVIFVRKVLDIVPETMFDMLYRIAQLRRISLHVLPLKFERKVLKDHSKLNPRFDLAYNTHQISVFTEGILNMKTTLFGVIEVEPKQLLEDGIRKELVYRIAKELNNSLTFNNHTSSRDEYKYSDNMDSTLISVGDKLGSLQQSFEHIQDYIKVYGLKVWQEEFTRIINYYVEQESNRFLRRKIFDHQSVYQSEHIRIPSFVKYKTHSAYNFTGRVVNELIAKTHYTETIYADFKQAWFHPSNYRISVGIRSFNLILQGLGAVGLNGLDKLIAYMIVADLQEFCKIYIRKIGNETIKLLTQFKSKLMGGISSSGSSSGASLSYLPPSAIKLYSLYCSEFNNKKWFKTFGRILSAVGQKQLIRRQMNCALNFQAKIDSKMLICTLEAMNDALLHDVKAHYRKPHISPYPDDDNAVLGDLSEHLNFVGICNPMAKIYITCDPLPCLPIILFLYIISELNGLMWNTAFNSLCRITTNMQFDCTPLIVGILTILKQFHPNNTQQLIALLCQYIRTHIHDQGEKINEKSKKSINENSNIPKQAKNALHFLDLMCKYGAHVDRKDVAGYLPAYMFDSYDTK